MTSNAIALTYGGKIPTAHKLAREWHEHADITQACLDKAARKMKKWADTKRQHLKFSEGDLVLIKLLPQQFKSLRQVHKGLVKKYEGPFSIIKRVGKVFYQVQLPPRLKIHPVFHVSFLKPYHADMEDPSRGESKRALTVLVTAFDKDLECILADRSVAMDYFASIGYSPLVPMNPLDFLLDLANGKWVFSNESGEEQAMVNQTLINSYKKLVDGKVKAELEDDHDENENTDPGFDKPENLFVEQNLQVALLYFYCDIWGFIAMLNAIFAFPQERMMLEKERSSGMYGLSSYFNSIIFADLPVQFVLHTVFISFTYYMAGFKLTFVNLCHTLFIVLYSFFISQGLGLAIGALVMKQKSALFLGDTLMLSFMLTSGFYIQNVPCFMAWIRYISVSHHTFKLLLGSQYKTSDTCENEKENHN
ncbi:hypothetical protein EZV62_008358 [Acer yangbiense]|uniref:Uncharacterized protein n=1 Tax=Acer yangbiense TaxID=1000413 RepID=A0A5C7ICN3_9ROSI|nr:hypothetical protein EZV62_008358 [Acer yangbiense]